MRNIIKEKGITLVALVVTIIILLILAGVAISAITGDNGLFRKANESAKISDIVDTKEQIKMELTTSIIDKTGSYDNQDVIKAVKKVTGIDVEELAQTVKSKKGNDVDISDLWKEPTPMISFQISFEDDTAGSTEVFDFEIFSGATWYDFFNGGEDARLNWFIGLALVSDFENCDAEVRFLKGVITRGIESGVYYGTYAGFTYAEFDADEKPIQPNHLYHFRIYE